MITCAHPLHTPPNFQCSSSFLSSIPKFHRNSLRNCRDFYCYDRIERVNSRRRFVCQSLLPADPRAPSIDSQSIAPQLFAASLFPYLGFLYFITKSKSAPKLTLFGFYFLLVFVGATIPAGIYAKLKYGTSLANVDWLHGAAESLLTLTNLFIVLGLREGLRKAADSKQRTSNSVQRVEDKNPSI